MPYICKVCGWDEPFGKGRDRCPNCDGAREKAESLEWGTYGLDAAENHAIHGTPLPELQQKTLGELDDDHLKRILMGGAGASVDDEYKAAIILILKAREADEENDARHSIRRRDAIEATRAQVSGGAADKNGEGRD